VVQSLGRAFSHNFSFATIVQKSLARLKTLSIRGSHWDGDYKPMRVALASD